MSWEFAFGYDHMTTIGEYFLGGFETNGMEFVLWKIMLCIRMNGWISENPSFLPFYNTDQGCMSLAKEPPFT